MKRDYRKFYTYPETADFMVELAELQDGMRVLEPSAGEGAIVKAIKKQSAKIFVHCVEIDSDCRKALAEAGADSLTSNDFLMYSSPEHFDRVIANPPFGNGVDLDAHVSKMYECLKPGGRMIVIVPTAFKDPNIAYTIPMENWSKNSDGTITDICLAVYNKPMKLESFKFQDGKVFWLPEYPVRPIKCVWDKMPPERCIIRLCECAKEETVYNIAVAQSLASAIEVAPEDGQKIKCTIYDSLHPTLAGKSTFIGDDFWQLEEDKVYSAECEILTEWRAKDANVVNGWYPISKEVVHNHRPDSVYQVTRLKLV